MIISPDSATIDDSLIPLIDTVQLEYIKSYYSHIQQMEIWKHIEPEESKWKTEQKIQRAKWMEMEVHDFKYYEIITICSYTNLLSLFNEYPWEKPSLTCEIFKKNDLFTKDLRKLAEHYHADYIISYKNIHTDKEDNKLNLKVTTVLYSNKDSRIIFEKETKGNTNKYVNKYGELMDCENPLQCLLETSANSLTEELFKVLSKKHRK